MGVRPPEIEFMPGAVRNRCLREIAEETGAAVSEIELLTEIKAQLGRAREFAVGGGWSIPIILHRYGDYGDGQANEKGHEGEAFSLRG
jgi:hypothetical protein